jgi:triosephosphate isomerase
MRVSIVAGNWKMNGGLASNAALLEAISAGVPGVEVAVMAPFPYLLQCEQMLQGGAVGWGAQDVSEHDAGAYTGEVSGAMLREFGCRYVLVGHSERRLYHGESSALVVRKAVRACAAGLTPIVCVGETLDEREAGRTESVVGAQVRALLEGAAEAVLGRCVVAYEPVWAIGTGKTASPDQAQAVHAFIRGEVARVNEKRAAVLPILYGGSVKGANAASLFAMPDVDGGLVGGASLNAGEFLEICRAAAAARAT